MATAELLVADYPQILTHRLLLFLIYACVLQRSNICSVKQIYIFLSGGTFASSGTSPVRVRFPCVRARIRAMPSSPSGGSLLFRQHPGRWSRGTRLCPKPSRGNTASPGFSISGGSAHRTRCLSTQPAKPRLFSAHHETEQQKEKHQEPENVRAHTYAVPPPSSPAMFNRVTATFLSSLNQGAKTCFASTAALALQTLLQAAGLSFCPQI